MMAPRASNSTDVDCKFCITDSISDNYNNSNYYYYYTSRKTLLHLTVSPYNYNTSNYYYQCCKIKHYKQQILLQLCHYLQQLQHKQWLLLLHEQKILLQLTNRTSTTTTMQLWAMTLQEMNTTTASRYFWQLWHYQQLLHN